MIGIVFAFLILGLILPVWLLCLAFSDTEESISYIPDKENSISLFEDKDSRRYFMEKTGICHRERLHFKADEVILRKDEIVIKNPEITYEKIGSFDPYQSSLYLNDYVIDLCNKYRNEKS